MATLPSPYLFSRVAHGLPDRDAFMREYAREVLAPVARELRDNGYGLLHLQEPWLAYFGIDEPAWTELEKALSRCARPWGPTATGRPSCCTPRSATPPPTRIGCRASRWTRWGSTSCETDTDALGRWRSGCVAGALDGRNSVLEPAEATADVVAHLAEQVGAPAVYVSSCCELEFLPTPVAEQKVARLGEVAALLKERLA